MTQLEKMQLRKYVEKIIQDSKTYKDITLEMTLVLDYDIERSELINNAKELSATFKSFGETFRAVHLNGVKWVSDTCIQNQVTSFGMIQTEQFFLENESTINPIHTKKSLNLLLQNLKFFHTRSKLVLILTEGNYTINDTTSCRQSLTPFLKEKLLILNNGNFLVGNQLFLSLFA